MLILNGKWIALSLYLKEKFLTFNALIGQYWLMFWYIGQFYQHLLSEYIVTGLMLLCF